MAEEKRETPVCPAAGPPYAAEDEIDIYELFLVLWRRKRVVFFTFLVFVLAAALYAFLSPPEYKIIAQIKPVAISTENNKAEFVLSGEDIRKWFSERGYQFFLAKQYPNYANLEFSAVTNRKGSVVFIETFCQNSQKCVEIFRTILNNFKQQLVMNSKKLNEIRNTLLEDIKKLNSQLEKLDLRKQELSRKIAELTKKIEVKKKEEELLKKKILSYDKAISELQFIIKEVNKNTQELIKSRNELLKQNIKETQSLSMLLHSNIIQQNIAYVSNLELRILNLNKEKTELQNRLNNVELNIIALQKQIKDLEEKRDKELEKDKEILKTEIEKLKIKLKGLDPFEIIQPPISSPEPVKPKRALILAVAAVSGLFVGVFLAFFVEWWEEARRRHLEEAREKSIR